MSDEQHKFITIHDSDDLLLSKVEHDDVLFQAVHKIDHLEELVEKQGREIEQLRAELLHERQERLALSMKSLSTHVLNTSIEADRTPTEHQNEQPVEQQVNRSTHVASEDIQAAFEQGGFHSVRDLARRSGRSVGSVQKWVGEHPEVKHS